MTHTINNSGALHPSQAAILANYQAHIMARRVALRAQTNTFLSKVAKKISKVWNGIQKFAALCCSVSEPQTELSALPHMQQPITPGENFFSHKAGPDVVAKIFDFALPEIFFPNDKIMQVSKSFLSAARAHESSLFISRPQTVTRILEEAQDDVRKIKLHHLRALQNMQSRIPFVFPDHDYSLDKLKRFLAVFPRLTSLDLFECGFLTTPINTPPEQLEREYNAALIAIAEHCRDIQSLRWGCYGLVNDGIVKLSARCPNLRSIEIRYIGDTGVVALAEHCSNLQSLHVSGLFGLSDIGIAAIAKFCHNIQDIHLRSAAITDKSVYDLIVGCPQIQSIGLFRSKQITDDSICTLAEKYPHLQSINLGSCDRLTPRSLKALGEHCHELEHLEWSHDNPTNAAAMAALGAGCPHLEEIDFYLTQITDEEVRMLATGCRELRRVSLMSCHQLTGAGVVSIAENCPELETLFLDNGFTQITDETIFAIAQHCPKLQGIYFNASSLITIEGLEVLACLCPQLQVVQYCYQSNMPQDRMAMLRDMFPQISFYH